MDSIKKIERKVLVVEDSRPDRLRFRSIFEMTGADFRFAWDAKAQKVPEVDEILKLIEGIKPSFLLLDLAWTTEDDRILQKFLFQDKSEIERAKKEIEEGNDKFNKKTWISGFLLLEKIKSKKNNKQFKQLKIIVTTQYVPAVAYGLRRYLWIEFSSIIDGIIHKWRDEKKLMSII